MDVKWALRKIYYAEYEYYLKYNTYSSCLDDLGLKKSDLSGNLSTPVIEATRSAFESYFPSADGAPVWTIYQDGRIAKVNDSLKDR